MGQCETSDQMNASSNPDSILINEPFSNLDLCMCWPFLSRLLPLRGPQSFCCLFSFMEGQKTRPENLRPLSIQGQDIWSKVFFMSWYHLVVVYSRNGVWSQRWMSLGGELWVNCEWLGFPGGSSAKMANQCQERSEHSPKLDDWEVLTYYVIQKDVEFTL